MTCPHATTTTLLWVYGEGPASHLHHVVGCPECQAVLDAASEVAPVSALLPAAPSRRRRWPVFAAGLAFAAAAVLMLAAVEQNAPEPSRPADLDDGAAALTPFDSGLDGRLDDLDLALDQLEHDLSTL